MQKEVKKSWALFIGIGVMMIAHGLQMQVMGIRSVLEDFSVFTTGIFMSGYYVCLLYTSPSPRDVEESRMPSSA